ncbi:hypothetical protein NDU88_003524 [Pleurodeles waltl]|uniref:Uncharacterized protein n=1 Tax=Pleurodeles waltl TaxID=8319 RepID=A0AAV7WTV8_PLEWA|nr:hypothetical protein NDU88_003524 [Pleurodeles waltl]
MSVSGRKVKLSPERGLGGPAEVLNDLQVVLKQVQRGGARFVRCSGASFRQRVGTGGNGAGQHGAVMGLGRSGARSSGAHALAVKCASKRSRLQAPSPLEDSGEQREQSLEERRLRGARKTAAPTDVEFVDSSGVVLRCTICGEASGDGKAGMAQVRLVFWQPGHGASQTGCDSPHALGRHEEYMATQRLGRPAGGKHLLVRVGAPLGHRIEEKVKPGAVRLTSQDASGYGVGGQDICPGTGVLPSTSRGAGLTLEQFEEELLDYEEEVHELEKGHMRAV